MYARTPMRWRAHWSHMRYASNPTGITGGSCASAQGAAISHIASAAVIRNLFIPLRHGKIYVKLRALARFALHQHIPSGLLDNSVDDGEPQAAALAFFGGEKRLENMRPS